MLLGLRNKKCPRYFDLSIIRRMMRKAANEIQK